MGVCHHFMRMGGVRPCTFRRLRDDYLSICTRREGIFSCNFRMRLIASQRGNVGVYVAGKRKGFSIFLPVFMQPKTADAPL